jgi:uncharacterized protein (DUF1786 family)
MITDEKLIELVVNWALGALEYDDVHTDVGMGMSYDTAIKMAEESVYRESVTWNSSDSPYLHSRFNNIRDEVKRRVREQRKR